MNYRILLAEPKNCNPEALAIYEKCGKVDIVDCTRENILRIIPEFDVLVIRLRNTVDRELLERAKRLKCIVTATTGLDHIDLEAAAAKGVQVLSLKGETEFLSKVSATAEHTWALLLSLLRHIPQAFREVLSGTWNREAFFGNELKGKTIGIVGYGRLGKMVARYAEAFEMNILVADPYVPDVSSPIRKTSLQNLLADSDIVTLHVPLNSKTRGLIGKREFEQMKRGACLINTSRGDIVDSGALLEALQNGRLSGAALDVIDGETSSDPEWLLHHPLHEYARTHSNCLITPHLGGATRESIANTEIFMAEKLISFLQNA